jgi:putative hydrolase of the HAD superfamily
LSSDSLKLKDVSAVFFDFGDTLATLVPSREELFLRAAASLGLELELELEAVQRAYQIVDFHNKYSSVHVTDRETFYQSYNAQLAEALGISSQMTRLNPALASQFRNEKKWELFTEVSEVLGRLREFQFPLAIVANWDSNLSTLTEQLGIRSHFSAVVPSQLAGVEKPDAAIFRLAAEELSLSPSSQLILYLGNEYRADVMGARAAGLTPILIDRRRLYPHPDCPRFDSLLEWLDAMQ